MAEFKDCGMMVNQQRQLIDSFLAKTIDRLGIMWTSTVSGHAVILCNTKAHF